MSDRFTPVSSTQGGERFTPVSAQPSGGTVQPQIGPDFGQQVQQGLGLAQQGVGALGQANSLGGNFLGSFSPLTGALGSALNLGGGLAGIANAANNDNLGGALTKTQGLLGTAAGIGGQNSVYSGLLGGQTLVDSISNAASQLFGSGAGNAAINASTGANVAGAGLGGAVMGGISSIPIIWNYLNDNNLFGLLGPSPTQERDSIRHAFNTAWDPYNAAPQTLQQTTAATDPAELQKLLQTANYQLAQAPAVSHYTSTYGGANPSKGIAPLNMSEYLAQTPNDSMSAVLAYTQALDKLANSGVDVSSKALTDPKGAYNISDSWGGGDPAAVQTMLGGLWGMSGVDAAHPRTNPADPSTNFWNSGGGDKVVWNDATQRNEHQTTPWAISPEQAALFKEPGQRLQAIQTVFSDLNPNFSTSPLGQAITGLLQPAAASSSSRFTPVQPVGTSPQSSTNASRFTAV